MNAHFAHAMPFGAELQDAGVRFRLWAPAQAAIELVCDDAPGVPMTRADAGWFECMHAAAHAGSRYQFQLADGTRVPDPASRFQPEDVHAASEVVDPRAHAWHTPEWRGRPWRETVLYELHVGAFATDYDGVRRRLDHLATLGVTALELMPLSDFEGARNWGYDGVLPFAPAAAYGAPGALKGLIDAAHARGLMVFLDVVYNHFGPSGNYLGLYAPQFFTDRHHTPWGQAIDFSQPVVREFFVHNALYWLEEYRFDGLRLDAVDQIRDDSQPHILEELAARVRACCGDRHVHLVLENDANAAHLLARTHGAPQHFSAQWNDDFHHAAHVLATGEAQGYYADYAARPVAALARALAEGFVYQGAHSGYRGHARGEPSAELPPLAFVDFLQNHDQVGNRAFGERMAALVDPEVLATLSAIVLLAPAVPLLFMGGEWAATQPFLFFCDYAGELAAAVRDGRRREFAHFPAFADPAQRQRIPDPNAPATFAASMLDWHALESASGARHFALVRHLLALRQREIVPHLAGDLHAGTFAGTGGHALRVDWRLADGAILTLVANPGAVRVTLLDCELPGRRLFALPLTLPGPRLSELPPWSVAWHLQ